MFLMGDFNIGILKESSSDFLSTIYSSGFHPLITKPTRVGATSITLINIIFTNVLGCDAFLSGVIITDLTDHSSVFARVLYIVVKQTMFSMLEIIPSVILITL